MSWYLLSWSFTEKWGNNFLLKILTQFLRIVFRTHYSLLISILWTVNIPFKWKVFPCWRTLICIISSVFLQICKCLNKQYMQYEFDAAFLAAIRNSENGRSTVKWTQQKLGPLSLSHENQQSKWFYIKDSKNKYCMVQQ